MIAVSGNAAFQENLRSARKNLPPQMVSDPVLLTTLPDLPARHKRRKRRIGHFSGKLRWSRDSRAKATETA
jgi:hypothetical protein